MAIEPAICIETIFPDLSFEERLRRVAGHGFRFVEFWSWRDKDIGRLAGTAESSGLQIVNFSGQRKGDLVDPGCHTTVLSDFRSALAASNVLGNRLLMVLSNELGEEGRVVRPVTGERGYFAGMVEGLALLLRELPEDMTIVIEPLNTVVDHTGCFLCDLAVAARMVRRIADPRCKILCDFYHQGMMGDDPHELIEEYSGELGHVHIAEYPGRHEPEPLGSRWPDVLLHLQEVGYEGYVGFEFEPSGDSDRALSSIRRMWEASNV